MIKKKFNASCDAFSTLGYEMAEITYIDNKVT